MELAYYLSQERGRQAALAKAIGAHAPDVSRWADGKRSIPFDYGAPIELATSGLVTRQEMFPNDWERLWPELATPQSTTTAAQAEPAATGEQP
jgi:DNA-binding transcriptional regulator YdaS (Cro superfamily)